MYIQDDTNTWNEARK